MLKQSPAKDSRPQTSDSKAQAGAADTPRRGGTLPPYAEYERNTRCPAMHIRRWKNTSEACAQIIERRNYQGIPPLTQAFAFFVG